MMRTLNSRALLPLGLVAALVAAGRAAADPPADAFGLLREEQTVTGAAKRPQPLSETPSAVSVITAAEIEANGYHTLGEALRWVRGLFVTNDQNYMYLGIRGLQRPGDYNNKILLTLDGHALNGAVYGDAMIGEELGIDLEQVERIEVVRGPGSSLYGSSAVLGVINIVTRAPRSEPGLAADGRVGEGGERRAFVRAGESRAGLPEWRASLSLKDTRGFDYYYPQFDHPSSHLGIAQGVDGENAWAFLGRADWKGFSLAAKLNEREKHIPTGSFGTLFDDPRTRTYDGRDYVELAATKPLATSLELHARAYWDGARYHGVYVYGPDTAAVIEHDHGDGDVVGSEWRVNWSASPRQIVTAGAELQRVTRAWQKTDDEAPAYVYIDLDTPTTQGGAYLQDELRVGETGRLAGGVRLDAFRGYAPVASPRFDASVSTGPGTRWKLLAGSAFRAPSPYERYYHDGTSQVANPSLMPERVGTVEGSVEHHVGNLTAILSAYASRIVNLIDLAPVNDPPGFFTFENRQRVNSRGVEGEIQVVESAATRVRVALARQRTVDGDTGAELSNSPGWNGHVVFTHDPERGRFTLGAGLRFLSPRLTLQRQWTETAVVADTRLGWRAARDVLVGLEVKNLLDARYGDPGSAEHTQDEIPQDGRVLFLTLSLRPGPAR